MKNKLIFGVVLLTVSVYAVGCGTSEPQEVAGDNVIIETETQFAEDSEIIDIDSEEDVLANLEEIEGGDGTESTEIVESMDVAEEVFEPYIMYTNTGVNVRSQASKDSTLLGTLGINTEIRVIGEENGFSKFEFDGNIAYVKSTLLSKTKTEIKQTQSSGSSSSTDTSDSSSSSSGSSSSSESSGSSSGGGLVGLDGSTGLDVDKDADPIGDGSGGGVDDSNVTFH